MENKIKPINYVQSYVAFLDVLGFKELVYGKKAEDKEKLEKYFHHIEEFIIYSTFAHKKSLISYV